LTEGFLNQSPFSNTSHSPENEDGVLLLVKELADSIERRVSVDERRFGQGWSTGALRLLIGVAASTLG
jgi:hypothetical protein